MKTDKKHKQPGIFLGILFIICQAIADFFASGAIFKIFTSYKKTESRFDSSATVVLFKRLKVKTHRVTVSVKKWISKQFERSLVLKAFSVVSAKLFGISGRTLGMFTMTWSMYVIIISLIKRFSLLTSGNISLDIWCCVIVMIASIPCLFSDKPLSTLCSESMIAFYVLTGIFGVPPESMKTKIQSRIGQSVAVILGIAFGLLTYLIPPLHMILGLLAIIIVALILTYPEGGVVVSIAIAPFLGLSFAPSRILAAIVLFTAIAYGIKVIRGKRVFDFGAIELSFSGFMLAVFLGGFAPGESNTFEHAILCVSLMLIFPLTVNLMKYRRWLKACAFAFIVPVVVIAFVGIAQYCLGMAPSGWLDESLFGGIPSRAVSLFNNPNILGVYLNKFLIWMFSSTLWGNIGYSAL